MIGCLIIKHIQNVRYDAKAISKNSPFVNIFKSPELL